MNLADLRRTYTQGGLTEEDAYTDPIQQFALWFDQIREAGNPEPNAMALATVGTTGMPNVRIVLLKAFGPEEFVFYTNYESRKGAELSENCCAALLFYWPELERQVRIQGLVSITTPEESASYFASRPRGHQIGAWASKQSSVLPDRAALQAQWLIAEQRFPEVQSVPLPPFWGGYRLTPLSMEFWQGRPNRLHDRLEYVRAYGGAWERHRLSP